jgi:hypothetical protein
VGRIPGLGCGRIQVGQEAEAGLGGCAVWHCVRLLFLLIVCTGERSEQVNTEVCL